MNTTNKKIVLYTLLLVLACLYYYLIYIKVIDGFSNKVENKGWTTELKDKFIKYQSTVFENNYQFNVNELEKQASPEEVEHLFKTGYWPWPDDLKYLFLDAVAKRPIIKAVPGEALDDAMKLYNQNAARKLLAWNTQEGEFLLQGIIIPEDKQSQVNKSFLSRNKDTIKCGKDGLVKTRYNGYSILSRVETPIANEEVPKEVPGFTFVKNPCNPCVALEDNFSCPFNINMKTNNKINTLEVDKKSGMSTVWKQLWGL